jgi:hypothetical protein
MNYGQMGGAIYLKMHYKPIKATFKGLETSLKKIIWKSRFCESIFATVLLKRRLSRKAEGNGPMKP